MNPVSIAIPAYNSEKYIEKTIDSILQQTYSDFILTIIDDQSTDCTEEVVLQYKDPRIRFVKNSVNLGLNGNFSRCLEYMQESLYGLLICNDDIIENDYLEKKIAVFQTDPDIVLICNSTKIINQDGRLLFIRKTRSADVLPGKQAIYLSYFYGNIFGEPSGVMMKSSIIQKAGRFDTSLKYTLDWEFSVRIAAHGKVAFIHKPLNCFRVSQTSASSDLIRSRKNIQKEHEYVAGKIEKILAYKPSIFAVLYRKILFNVKFFARLFVFRIYSFK